MQLLATRGSASYMLLSRGRVDGLDRAHVRVYDQQLDTLSAELPALSVVARGYWEEPVASHDARSVVAAAEALLVAR